MARGKATTSAVEAVEEELNLDAKVSVRNIAGWFTGFARISEGYGDVTIAPNGSTRLSRNEIIAQVQSGNKLFTGVDGIGSHATLIIDDEATRVELDFENESKKQLVFSEEEFVALFNTPKAAFESSIRNMLVTRAEKFAAMQTVNKRNLNDYAKIKFLEGYTGYKLDSL